ncbi:MFS transporter [Kutzneria viridogrisea]|uniref:Major facilitator superfamily (MFS) profile domain-containing protein n=2 Tax=Kutzneria TaxID=43356 RepID=W5WVJ5_9PSEU|nr:MFS transporter [Kutzneria albida]AHI02140.1 hypothetical protein KALB_8783 [Kutzneria albida DSM 43870]MBA8929297.1 MFS family permease [Kutzneria viridogrisea]
MTAGPTLFMDLRPLRESPAFRRLWLGSALSSTGGVMTTFAVSLQVFMLTGSSLAVGAVGLATALPGIVFGLLGGAIADAVDRRKLVLVTNSAMAVVSALLAVQAFAGLNQLWPLYTLVAVQSVLNTVNSPARSTFVPRLLSPERLPAGIVLSMFTFHLSVTVGPTLAGLVTAAWGLKLCYLLDAVSFAAALYGVFRLPPMPPEGGATRASLRSVGDGLRFIRRSKVLTGAFLSDMNAMVLGIPIAVFPAINAERFGGSAQTLGLLTAAVAAGGVLGTVLSGPVRRVSRHGLGMLVAGSVWGLALAGFGLAHDLWLALTLLGLAGAADVLSVVFRSTMVQVSTPDGYRGRISAAEYVVGGVCPQLGNFRAGAVGSLTSSGFSVVSGGLATVLGSALIGLALPAFTRYRASREPAH